MQVMLPRTTLEQRHPLYADVEALIDFGFLSHSITVNGAVMGLRSLGPGDLFMLKHRVATGADDEWKVWAVASSIWMVKGQCLLGASWAVIRVAETVRSMPRQVREILFSQVMGLFNRQNKAIDATEAYCYETVSRYKWKAFGKHLPAAHAGVPGVEHIGTNHIQRMWSFYNSIEDQRVAEEATWEGVKLTTSPHAHKGIKKIDERDKQSKEEEKIRRQTLMDRTYYIRRGLLEATKEGGKKAKGLGLVGETKTSDDLVDEMHRWVSGQDDLHDQVVNGYKQRIVHNYENHKKEQEDRAETLREMQEQESDMPTGLVAWTPEQLADILKDRQPGAAGVRQVGGGMNTVRDYLYQKYLGREADAGVLKPREDGGLEIEGPDAEGLSLDEQIAQRQVLFDTGDGG